MKFKGYGIAENMYNTLSQYYIDAVKQTRLMSSHNYDGLQLDKMEYLIINDLPKFKDELQNIIDNFNNFEIHIDTEIDGINKEISKKENKIRIYNKEISALKTRQQELQQELNIKHTAQKSKQIPSISKPKKSKTNIF